MPAIMRILFIGDIVGRPGVVMVKEAVPLLRARCGIDVVIANAENAAGGFGITPSIAEELFALGLDVLTSGNHVWDKRELFDYFPRQPRLLRRGRGRRQERSHHRRAIRLRSC